MNETSRLALTDAGLPDFPRECGFGMRFRYWRGASGKRYLFTAIKPAEIADFSGGIVVLAVEEGDGSYRAVDVGLAEEMATNTPAQDRAVFVHLLATGDRRRLVLNDLIGSEQRMAA